jgi:hypothetical protein
LGRLYSEAAKAENLREPVSDAEALRKARASAYKSYSMALAARVKKGLRIRRIELDIKALNK